VNGVTNFSDAMSVSAALKVLAPTKNGYVMAKPVLAKELTLVQTSESSDKLHNLFEIAQRTDSLFVWLVADADLF
jgi:hypothetical protein